jgi:hypothetical protein
MATAARRPATELVLPDQVPLVYLDANVLLPQYLRSVFLDLADADLIRVYWSVRVLEEVRRNLMTPAFGRTARQADALLSLITQAFPDAVVSGSEILESRFAQSTDPKDVHVAAGALKLSQAVYADRPVVLVTSNTKHLPQVAFAGTQVQSVRPSTFLTALLAARPEVATVLAAMLTRFKAPPVNQEGFLAIMDHSGCRVFATALAKQWGFTAT